MQFLCPHCDTAFRLQPSMAALGLDCPWCDGHIDAPLDHLQQEPRGKATPIGPRAGDEIRNDKASPELPALAPPPDPEEGEEDAGFITPASLPPQRPRLPEPEPKPVPQPAPDAPTPLAGNAPVEREPVELRVTELAEDPPEPSPVAPQPVPFVPPVLPKPRPFKARRASSESATPASIATPLPPVAGERRESGAGISRSLPLTKSHLPKLLTHDEFLAEQAKLETQQSPGWEQKKRRRKHSAKRGEPDRETTRVLRPAADGSSAMEWVTVDRDELFSRSSRILNRTPLFALGAVVLGGFSLFGILLVRASWVSLREHAPAQHVEFAEATPNDDLKDTVLGDLDVARAETAARAFCSASTADERLRHVRQPERVRSLVLSRPADPIEVGRRLRAKRLDVGDIRVVVLAFEVDEYPGFRFIAVEQTAIGEYLVDWEFATAYQQMPLLEFQKKRPSAPVPFRVKVKESNRESIRFPSDRYDAYALSYPGRDFSLFGYVESGSDEGLAMRAETLAATPSLILDLRYSDGSPDEVEITGIVHRSWFY